MTASELCYLSASEAIARFKARILSPIELVEALIARHDEVEERINATTILYHERALEQARKAEARYAKPGARLRRLEGVPVMIKDLHPIKGEINPQSCRIFAQSRATDTLPTVERLLRAGAIPLARSTSSELGIPTVCTGALWGVTRNPWNLAMSPGGSSGGSGAPLAGALGPLLPIGDPIAIGVGPRLSPPSPSLPLGTDELGRSHLPRLIGGILETFLLSGAAVLLTGVIGVFIGSDGRARSAHAHRPPGLLRLWRASRCRPGTGAPAPSRPAGRGGARLRA